MHTGFTDTTGKHIRIIHRDLKPQNILIAEYKGNFTPLITDFGISRIVNEEDLISRSKVENTTDAGTIVYKAPEQIQGLVIKSNLDLWAFGVMLFKMLTGRFPFYSDAPASTETFRMEVTMQIVQGDLERVFGQLRNQPDRYQQIIRRCLVRDLDQRANRAAELLDLLDEIPQTLAGAQAALNRNDVAGAQRQFEHVLTLRPDNAVAKQGLTDCSRIKRDPAIPAEAIVVEKQNVSPEEPQTSRSDLGPRQTPRLAMVAQPPADNETGARIIVESRPELFGQPMSPPRQPTRLPLILGGVGLVVALVIGGFWFVSNDEPAENDVPAAVQNSVRDLPLATDMPAPVLNADSLFQATKTAFTEQGLDKAEAASLFRRAVAVKPSLAAAVYPLFADKAKKFNAISPALAQEYQALANQFKR